MEQHVLTTSNTLNLLHGIIQEVNDAPNLKRALAVIVCRVKQAIAADVCSVYLNNSEQQEYILMATDGLCRDAVGKVRLPMGHGLIGVVSERAEPLNLSEAATHPQYVLTSETGEIGYHGFLGVPIIQHRKVLGVLVMRRRKSLCFANQDVTFVMTLAAQLAGAITHAKASGELKRLQNQKDLNNKFFQGQPGSNGIAIGNLLVVYPLADLNAVPDHPVEDLEAEITTFKNALARSYADLDALAKRTKGWLSDEDQALFDAWKLMLQSDILSEEVIQRIHNGNWAQGALRETIHEHALIFEEMEDPYLRERARDIRDLGQRILMHLQDNVQTREYPQQTILAGEDLSASQLVDVPRERLVGVISTTGSKSSHVAILAYGMGVPAVMGVTNLPLGRMDGLEVILDGHHGRIYIMPTPGEREEYQRLANADRALVESLDVLRGLPSCTLDNHPLPLYLNIGLASESHPMMGIEEASGVGLYRTEVPFMIRDKFPSEEEQIDEYRRILTLFHPKPVTFRTLDIGGDKSLPYFLINESNPFLGWRGIRISLDHPELFLTQIRAIMQAAIGLDNARILLPMISTLEEVDEALELIKRAYQELLEDHILFAMPKIGVMVEVPAAVYQVEAIAKRVDFLSIGTNDLTQYLLAVDRNNREVASLYDDLHPAVLRAINQILVGAIKQDCEVSVCGEMAGNPMAAILLLGMGITSLSMNANSILPVKAVIRAFALGQARELLKRALNCDFAAQVHKLLENALESEGLGVLVR